VFAGVEHLYVLAVAEVGGVRDVESTVVFSSVRVAHKDLSDATGEFPGGRDEDVVWFGVWVEDSLGEGGRAVTGLDYIDAVPTSDLKWKSRIASFILVARLASLSAAIWPGTPAWPGVHFTVTWRWRVRTSYILVRNRVDASWEARGLPSKVDVRTDEQSEKILTWEMWGLLATNL
jgi:hypothetical protein